MPVGGSTAAGELTSSWNSSLRKFKVSVVGDIAVGKTCLALHFVKGLFNEEHRATISDIESRAVEVAGERVALQIWDTAGQERFRSLLPLYMKGIHGAIIVYDVTDRVSFDHVCEWLCAVRRHASEETVVMLVGNKLDLVTADRDTHRAVQRQEGEAMADEANIFYMEASAKTGEHVDEVFMKLAEEMVKKHAAPHTPHVYQGVRNSQVPTHDKRPCCR